MNIPMPVRIALVLLLALSFLQTGLAIEIVAILTIIMLLTLFFRDKAYAKIDKLMEDKLPFTRKLHPWARKALLIIIFIIALIIIKQVIYFLLALAGFDVQKAMMAALNATK